MLLTHNANVRYMSRSEVSGLHDFGEGGTEVEGLGALVTGPQCWAIERPFIQVVFLLVWWNLFLRC